MTFLSLIKIYKKPNVILAMINTIASLQAITALQIILAAIEGPLNEQHYFLLCKTFFLVGLVFDVASRVLITGVERDEEQRRDFTLTLIGCSCYAKCLAVAIAFLSITIIEMHS